MLGDFGHDVLSTSEEATTFSPVPSSQPRILGLSTTGEAITLEICDSGDFTVSSGVAQATYHPRFVLLGGWYAAG